MSEALVTTVLTGGDKLPVDKIFANLRKVCRWANGLYSRSCDVFPVSQLMRCLCLLYGAVAVCANRVPSPVLRRFRKENPDSDCLYKTLKII